MGNRFLVTGVQLEMIKGLLKAQQFSEIAEIVEEILEKQWVGYTENEIKYDVIKVIDSSRLSPYNVNPYKKEKKE